MTKASAERKQLELDVQRDGSDLTRFVSETERMIRWSVDLLEIVNDDSDNRTLSSPLPRHRLQSGPLTSTFVHASHRLSVGRTSDCKITPDMLIVEGRIVSENWSERIEVVRSKSNERRVGGATSEK